jgi:type II secretory pathway pseudopilin PulG
MAALLASMSVMCVMLSVALPVWRTVMQREREAELIFRGQQYARAIALFQRHYAGTFPSSVEALVEGRFLRRRYLDPMTNREFRLLYADVPYAAVAVRPAPTTIADPRRGIVGVVSGSSATSLRSYGGRWRYDEWMFVATQEPPTPGAEPPRETKPTAWPTRR